MARASLAYVVFYVALGATSPYMAPYLQSLGLSLGEIGLLGSLSAALGLVAGPIWGSIADRFPGSRLLIPLAALLAASGALALVSMGRSILIPVAYVGLAIGLTGTGPLLDARALDLVHADRDRFAHLRLWGSASFMVAAGLVGLFFIRRDSPGGFFYVYVPFLVLTAIVALGLGGRSAPSARGIGILRAPGRVLRNRSIALFLVGALVAWTALVAQLAFFSIYLEGLGAPPEMVGWAWSLGAVLEVPAMLFFPQLARRFGAGRLVVVGALIMAFREFGSVVLTDPTLLIWLSTLQGLGYALALIGGVTFVSRHAPTGTAATAQGILNSVSIGLATIIGGTLGGLLAGWLTIRGMYVIATATGFAGAGLIALAVLPGSRRSDSTELADAAAPAEWLAPDPAAAE
jgi:PPP family 3-phenylpropionic acid transporter